tara:strand:+ start:2144 stop:2515 length:372 start_codon:yes stop_codon:yes gene_type:complete
MSIKSVLHDTTLKHVSKFLAPEHARALASAIADDAEGRVVKSVVDMIRNGHSSGPKKKTVKKIAKKTAVKKGTAKPAAKPTLVAVPKATKTPAKPKSRKKPARAVAVASPGDAAFPEADNLDL